MAYPSTINSINYPGYPVYVDPFGTRMSGSGWVGNPASSIQRTSVSFVPAGPPPPGNLDPLYRWFSFTDDVTFGDTGVPNPGGNLLEREGRYTWAYLCRLVKLPTQQTLAQLTPADLTIDTTIVVYDKRSIVPGTNGLEGEKTYNAVYPSQSNIGSMARNQVILNQTTGLDWPPPVRKGSWIFDPTIRIGVVPGYPPNPNPQPGDPGVYIDVHAFFYRVVSVTPIDATSVSLELQTNVRPTYTAGATAILMEGVAEVFERGILP